MDEKKELDISNMIIADIKYDELYDTIQAIAREETLQTILEIGSSTGQGSTEAFALGIQDNPNQPILFCVEVLKALFRELQKRYADNPQIKCYNASTVSWNQFPSEAEVIQFYDSVPTNLRNYSLELVLEWLQRDREYVKNSGLPCNAIELIKQEHEIDYFDAVLIDGSEFTGHLELDEIYGAKIILLDDINAFKNYQSHQRLLVDPNYVLVAHNLELRNGYSIFKRLDSFLKLRDINNITFPEWQQPEDTVSSEIGHLIQSLMHSPDRDRTTLLINVTDLPPADADLIVSGIVMGLLAQDQAEQFELSAQNLEISLIHQLTTAQWQQIVPRIQSRISLACDSHTAITAAGAQTLPVDTIQDFDFKAST